MQLPSTVTLFAIKESFGEIEGRAFSSTTFHLDVDLKENSAGRSLGKVTRPFKLGDAKEFDKWAHLPKDAFPMQCDAVFEISAAREDKAQLVLVSIVPKRQPMNKAA